MVLDRFVHVHIGDEAELPAMPLSDGPERPPKTPKVAKGRGTGRCGEC